MIVPMKFALIIDLVKLVTNEERKDSLYRILCKVASHEKVIFSQVAVCLHLLMLMEC